MKDFFKRLFGKDSILSIVRSLIIIIPFALATGSNIVNAVDERIDARIKESINPLNSWMITTIVFDVNKQYYKIKNNPIDIKPIDIEWTIKVFDGMREEYKTPILRDKIAIIRSYYLNEIEGKS